MRKDITVIKIVLGFLLLLFSLPLFAQDSNLDPDQLVDNHKQTTPDSAKYFIGSLATVCGKVESTKMLKNGTTFLNFGKPYPDQTISVVIDSSVAPTAAYSVTLMGKNVCITGRILNRKGIPEIKVKSKNQLRFPE